MKTKIAAIFIGILILLLINSCYNTKNVQLTGEGITKKTNSLSTNSVVAPTDGEVTTEDNKKISYTLFENTDAKYGIVLLHMLDRDRHDWDSFAKLLQTAGYSVVSIDLRGHGQSTPGLKWRAFSEPDFKKFVFDAKAASDVLSSKNIGNIVVIGASIGANTALNYDVNDKRVKAIILLSPGLDYRAVRVLDSAEKNNKPIFVIASEEDLYAFETAKQIISASKSDIKNSQYYKNAGHGTKMFEKEPVGAAIIDWLTNNRFN